MGRPVVAIELTQGERADLDSLAGYQCTAQGRGAATILAEKASGQVVQFGRNSPENRDRGAAQRGSRLTRLAWSHRIRIRREPAGLACPMRSARVKERVQRDAPGFRALADSFRLENVPGMQQASAIDHHTVEPGGHLSDTLELFSLAAEIGRC